ncbi:hypothetical protein G9A89_002033 [Geosiphon pyriformis]|nr:hypothetical protein G9A89_002033 [Geosiphon pyriformis]
MTIIKTKSKKAAPDICPEISNKISTRRALSVVKATRQNILEVFSLPSNRNKLPLIITEATSLSLAGFLSVKVPSKRHTWISPSVVSTLTKNPKVFNNRPVNKLVFPSIDSTSGASSTTSSKKMVKKTKSSEKWEQSLVSAIVTPNPFVVPNEILDEIFIASSSMSFKMGQNQSLAVLSNVVSSNRLSLVLEAKQSSSIKSSVLGNWTDQMKTESSPPLISGVTSGDAWETITSRQKFAGLVPGATFKIKLAYVKTVFQSVHGFLGAKSVSKDNVKLFCVEFASQMSLKAVFLVELTSFIHLATLKIAKFLVISESGSPSAAVVLCDIPLGVFAVNIKTALNVFSSVVCIVLKPIGVWQYMVVYFEKLNFAVSALNHWSVLAKLVNFPPDCTAFEISDMISQVGGQTCFIPQSPDSGCHFHFALVMFGSQADLDFAVAKTGMLRKTLKVFKPCFVGSLSYAKTFASPIMSEFFSLVASTSSVAIVNPAVGSRLNSLKKQISDLTVLVKSIVEPVGSLVVLIKKNLLSMKYASNNFANLLVGISKDIACLRSEVDFGNMDYNNMQTAKPSLLNKDTVEHVIALWRMSGAKIRVSVLTDLGGLSHIENA